MSLFDIDRHSEDRGSPTPNHSDSLTDGSIKAHGTNSVNYVTDAATPGAILSGNARLIKQGVATVIAPNGVSGLITTTTTSVAHGLGYTPMMMAYMNNVNGGGQGFPLPMWISFGNNTGGSGATAEYLAVIRYMTFSVDATNLNILTYSAGTAVAANYHITYYLYQQTAS